MDYQKSKQNIYIFSSFEDGVVEVICKPGETKIFKLVLRNALSKLGLEEEEEVGLVVEELGMLKEEASVELSDEHQLCNSIGRVFNYIQYN